MVLVEIHSEVLPDQSVVGDLKTSLDKGPQVTLAGSDDEIIIQRDILEIRSTALGAVFSHDRENTFSYDRENTFSHDREEICSVMTEESKISVIVLKDPEPFLTSCLKG